MEKYRVRQTKIFQTGQRLGSSIGQSSSVLRRRLWVQLPPGSPTYVWGSRLRLLPLTNIRGSRLRLLPPHSSNNYESGLSNYSPHSGQSFNGQDISPLRIQCWFDSNLPYHSNQKCRILAFFLAVALSIIAQGKKKIPNSSILSSNVYERSYAHIATSFLIINLRKITKNPRRDFLLL